MDGAPRVRLAEGRSAVHAPGRLTLTLHVVRLDRRVDLAPVGSTLLGLAVGLGLALDLDKAAKLVELGSNLLLIGSLGLLRRASVCLNLDLSLGHRVLALPRVSIRRLLASTLVIQREHLHKVHLLLLPVIDNPLSHRRPSRLGILLEVLGKLLLVRVTAEALKVAHGLRKVDLVAELALGVVAPGDTARHAGTEVLANLSEDHDTAAGHVLETVVTTALSDDKRTRVANAEPLTRHTAEESLARSRSVARHVASDNVILPLKAPRKVPLIRHNHNLATAQPLGSTVVRVTPDNHRDTPRHERSGALPRAAREVERDGVVGKTLGAVGLGDLVREDGGA
mmetsp:Transcript_6302/g.12168  ORF Transcript_6302/g.12168 Transcript_6302/m.12168 type:complete len:339 (+) Transcript_6302:1812-2828(+)